jgi:hypothetical protein
LRILKLIYLTLLQWVKQIRRLPRSFAESARHKRREVVLNEREAERLDRIRNPSNYRGK